MLRGHGPRVRRTSLLFLLAVLACVAVRTAPPQARVLHAEMHHLGNDETPDWTEAPVAPEDQPLEITFDSRANEGEWLLEVAARHVNADWVLELNGRELALLEHVGELSDSRYPVPPGMLVDGRNRLVVRNTAQPDVARTDDDITFGNVRLYPADLRTVEQLGRLAVTVVDAATGAPLPARVTVARPGGDLVPVYYAERPLTAVRPGIAYTGDGAARLEVPAGPLVVYASRGMEWSVAEAHVEVGFDRAVSVRLAIRREVDTSGWVAADTHVHTLTHSGHGDASVEERLVTLAGEGVELAIATDHNHNTDYRPLQRELALTPWFTPVVGNEVTSDNGHMNAFPLDPADALPPHAEESWERLVAGIRARGARVVILNHPRWPEGGKDPLSRFGFDERTGLNTAGQRFTFDCIELVNSDCPTAPTSAVLPVWFALLESGQRFTAVGSSDSHAVGVIVGQGRTYVPVDDADPARIDVDAACDAFLAGRVSVSLGMFATIEVDGHGMGATLSDAPAEVEARVRVRHPSWVVPRRLELVVNGTVAATVPLDDGAPGDGATLRERTVRLALPRASNWIVAVASGDPVTAPFWKMKVPRTLGITNPVYAER